MTTDRKAQANRANAQRSTGPRSEQGKRASSLNSLRHGLNLPLDAVFPKPVTRELAALVAQDGIDADTAAQIADRILDYERNQAHQRRLAAAAQEAYRERSSDELRAQLRQEWPEMDMLDDALEEEKALHGKVPLKDIRQVMQFKQRMAHLTAKANAQERKALVQQEQAARRYLTRSSNQLIKALKALSRLQ